MKRILWLMVVTSGCQTPSSTNTKPDAGSPFELDGGTGQISRDRGDAVDGGSLSVSGCRSASGQQLLVRASTIVDPNSCAVLLYELTALGDGGFATHLMGSGVTGPCFGTPFNYLGRDGGFSPSIYWNAEQLDFEVSVFGVNGRPFAFDIDGGGIWSDVRPIDGGSLRSFRVTDFVGASATCTF